MSTAQAQELAVLPELLEAVPPVYPEAALASGLEGVVKLELDVDAEGRVLDVRVTGPLGEGFDEAAVAAARSFRFKPALDDKGRPVPVTIGYALKFEAAQAPPKVLEGRIREAGTRQPLSGLTLRLVGPEGAQREVVTDESGVFAVAGLAYGSWELVAEGPGLDAEVVPLTLTEGSVVEVDLFLKRSRTWEGGDEVALEIEVVGERVRPEVTERRVSTEEIRYLPGTNGDVVRVVQNLPGVARPPLNVGQLIIRGTAPEDSAYYLDGGRVPIVFHFAGLSTVVNADSIEEVAFLPGNYGVRYGRTLGGVVDLRFGRELPERSRGYLSVDIFQATAFHEQKIGDKHSLTFSGRRSYIDAVLNPILNQGGTSLRAPRYYDGQVRWLHQTPTGGVVDVQLLASDDRFVVFGDDNEEESAKDREVAFGLVTTFQKLRARVDVPLGGGWASESVGVFGPELQEFDVGEDGEAFERNLGLALRQEFRIAANSERLLGMRLGVDVLGGRFSYLYDLPDFGQREEGTIWTFQPAVYAEPTVQWRKLQVIPGARLDASFTDQGYSARAVDPRLAVRQGVGSGTVLKATVGRYSQFPLPRQVQPAPEGDGNLDLEAAWSLQTSVGLEQRLGRIFQLELTPFASYLNGLVAGREDSFRFFTGPPPSGPLDTRPYANAGEGRVLGVEALVRFSTERTVGWLSLTGSNSIRQDRPNEPVELFDYDQPLVATLLASHQLPKRWRAGARLRYGSGNPYTPVVNRTFDLTSRTFVPVYGERSAGRLPPFYSIDLRIDKDYVFERWTLTTYLDLQNATSRLNPEVIAWNYDYSKEEPITGLPVIPAFGFRGEW